MLDNIKDESYSDLLQDLANAFAEINELKSEINKFKVKNPRGAGRKGRMTPEDSVKILELRRAGISYGKIAAQLNLPVGTVFNYIKLNMNEEVCASVEPSLKDEIEILEKAPQKVIKVNEIPKEAEVGKLLDKLLYRQFMGKVSK
jgi:hypothetical protein